MSDTATTEAPVKPAPTAQRAAPRPVVAPGWASPRYYFALAALVVFGVVHMIAQERLQLFSHKNPLPLLKPLSALDTEALAPMYRPSAIQPEPLSSDVEATLGTTEYISLLLDDLTRDRTAPDAVANLFVSYYTGKPDMVPHIPEQCMVASGWKLVDGPRVEQIPARDADGSPIEIGMAVCEFERRDKRGVNDSLRRTVAYFFFANGGYYADRAGVRYATQNPGARHAFYSKVELSFNASQAGAADGRLLADREETIRGAERLLKQVWPLLLREHYPDWKAAEKAASETP